MKQKKCLYLQVLIPAVHIHMTGKHSCCANRCGMFLSFILAAVGVAGAIYSFIVALLGLLHGPYCNAGGVWVTLSELMRVNYLEHPDLWGEFCIEPKNVVEFNVVLFSILMLVNSLQIILCAIQMINGLFGCLCGTCRDTRHTNITVTSAVNVSL
nr:transmembrane 4 L6 family member 1-like [Misgurnus anguillicaudatus]